MKKSTITKSFKHGLLLTAVILFLGLAIFSSKVFATSTLEESTVIHYKAASDGGLKVDYITTQSTGLVDVVIPSNFEGRMVTEIDKLAFTGFNHPTTAIHRDSIRSITFSENIKIIPYELLSNADNLETVVLPQYMLTTIGLRAFSGCDKLRNISIPSSVTSIYPDAFRNCSSFPSSITLPRSITSIGSGAFVGSNLQSIKFPNKMFNIDGSDIGHAGSIFNSNVTITGYDHTTAEWYASLRNLKFISLSIKYPLTFDSQGGSAVPTIQLSEYSSLNSEIISSRADYTFEGWFKEAACVNPWIYYNNYPEYSSDLMPAHALTLYAKWEPNAHVTATPSSSNSINVTWTGVRDADAYRLYRATSIDGEYTFLAETSTLRSYNNTGLTPDCTYYYKVRSYINGTYKNWSNIASAKPAVVVKPAVVTGAKAVSSSYNSIKVTWNKVIGASGYLVYRNNLSTGVYGLVATTTTPSYNNTGLVTGSTYYYIVISYKTDGNTRLYSDSWSTAAIAKVVPSPVTNVKSTSSSYSTINTTWNAVTGASGYEVFRSNTYNGTYTMVARLNALKFNNGGLTTGRGYYYKLRAYRTVGTTRVYSNWSNLGYAKVVPSPVTNVKAIRASSKSIRITWNKIAGVSGYEVYRSTSSNGIYGIVARTSSAYSYYNNVGLTKGKTYYYKVRSYRTVGTTKVYCNSWSNISYAKPY